MSIWNETHPLNPVLCTHFRLRLSNWFGARHCPKWSFFSVVLVWCWPWALASTALQQRRRGSLVCTWKWWCPVPSSGPWANSRRHRSGYPREVRDIWVGLTTSSLGNKFQSIIQWWSGSLDNLYWWRKLTKGNWRSFHKTCLDSVRIWIKKILTEPCWQYNWITWFRK